MYAFMLGTNSIDYTAVTKSKVPFTVACDLPTILAAVSAYPTFTPGAPILPPLSARVCGTVESTEVPGGFHPTPAGFHFGISPDVRPGCLILNRRSAVQSSILLLLS